MKKLLFAICFIHLSFHCFSQNDTTDLHLDIYFGSGFIGGDSLTLKIGATEVYNQLSLYSVPSYGSTGRGAKVIRYGNSLICINSNDEVQKLDVKNIHEIAFVFQFRNKYQEITVTVSSGKYLVFSINREGLMELTQLNKPPRFY